MAVGQPNVFFKNSKKSDKAGERAERQNEKAKRWTQRAEYYERKRRGEMATLYLLNVCQ